MQPASRERPYFWRDRRCRRTAMLADPSQAPGHSAHVAFRAKVHYPWHPARGSEVEVRYREKRGGEEVFFCPNADDVAIAIPAWMFDRPICSRMKLGARRTSLAALRELRSMLDELRSPTPITSSGRVASEESDGEQNRPMVSASASRTTVGDRVSKDRRTRSKAKERSRRAAQSSASASRERGKQKRGES